MTCRLLKDIVFPRLYSRLVLKAPQNWEKLAYLEELVASPGEGLQHVTSIRVATQRTYITVGQVRWNIAGANTELQYPGIYTPSAPTSSHLNSLVRLVIRRLPKRCLREFV